MRSVLRPLGLLLGIAVSLTACGHLGIDFGDDGTGDDGPAGGSGGTSHTEPSSGGTDAGSGGGDVGSGGAATGGQSSSGGAGTGGDGSSGGQTGSGGSDGGSDGAGGDTGSGGAATGGSGGADGSGGLSGSGGSGGTPFDCDTSEPACAVLAEALTHRYSFDGVGILVPDSGGGEPATLIGATLEGSGEVDLSGPGDYVSLPAGLIAPLESASFEVWFIWNGGESWQRLFEFGSEDAWGDPITYLYATPQAGGTVIPEIALGAGIRHVQGGDRQLRSTEVTAVGVLTQVVLLADGVTNRLTLYKNGEWVSERDTEVDLSGIQDQTNQLGRSLFDDDPNFDGVITEFRIYDAVLSAAAIAKSYEVGSDATFGP